MAVVAGYICGTVLACLSLWAVAGRRYAVNRDPQAKLGEQGARHIGLLSGLAGFAVTGMVLLVTLGRDIADTSSTPYTTVLTMFFVSWMAYAGTGFLFANIPDTAPVADGDVDSALDVPAALFAGAAATLEIAFATGWLALRPLFQAFELTRLSELAAPMLVAAAVASYGLVVHHLHRSGYGESRVLVAMPLLATAATLAYGLVVGMLGLRSDVATLSLIVSGFIVGGIAFAMLTTLPVVIRHARPARLLAAFGRYLVLAYVQAVLVLVGFLVLSVLGLA